MTGTPALTPMQEVTCIPRVGEHVALLTNTGETRNFVVVKVTYVASEAKGITGAAVLVDEIGEV